MAFLGQYRGGIYMFIILFVIALIELYVVKYAFFTFKTKSGGKGTAPKNIKKDVTPGKPGEKFVLKKKKGGKKKKKDDDDDDDDDDKDDDDDEDEDEDDDKNGNGKKKAAPAPAPAKPAAAPAPKAAPVATPVPVASEAQLITVLTNLCTTAGGTWNPTTKCCTNGKSLSPLVPVCP